MEQFDLKVTVIHTVFEWVIIVFFTRLKMLN